MEKPTPTQDKLAELAGEIGIHAAIPDQELGKMLSRLTDEMLDLMYSGNSQTAFELLSVVWPDDIEVVYHDNLMVRESLETQLLQGVKKSPFYQEWMVEPDLRRYRQLRTVKYGMKDVPLKK